MVMNPRMWVLALPIGSTFLGTRTGILGLLLLVTTYKFAQGLLSTGLRLST